MNILPPSDNEVNTDQQRDWDDELLRRTKADYRRARIADALADFLRSNTGRARRQQRGRKP